MARAVGTGMTDDLQGQIAVVTGAVDALDGCFLGHEDDVATLIREAKQIETEKLYRLGMNRL